MVRNSLLCNLDKQLFKKMNLIILTELYGNIVIIDHLVQCVMMLTLCEVSFVRLC